MYTFLERNFLVKGDFLSKNVYFHILNRISFQVVTKKNFHKTLQNCEGARVKIRRALGPMALKINTRRVRRTWEFWSDSDGVKSPMNEIWRDGPLQYDFKGQNDLWELLLILTLRKCHRPWNVYNKFIRCHHYWIMGYRWKYNTWKKMQN